MTNFDPSSLDLDINGDNSSATSGSNTSNSSNAQEQSIDPLSSKPEKKQVGNVSGEKDASSNPKKGEEDILGEVEVLGESTDVPSREKNTIASSSDETQEETSSPTIDDTVSDTSEIQEVGKQQQKTHTEDAQKIININITSLGDIVTLIDEKEYDYVTLEPEDSVVKVTFRQDNIDREITYIKYPAYTNILFQIKQDTGMMPESTGESQEAKGKTSVGKNSYHLAAKTVPGVNGEKVWLKTKKDTSQKATKKVQKTSVSTIFGFMGAVLFVGLILGGVFITFIVVNAKTVDDVKFFASLGINLNDINTFISQIVTVIFSILLFLCSAALAFALFKSLTTKKVFKKKRITYILLSTFLLMITFATGSAWMVIDQKIKNLPNWQEQAYGDLKIFDNDLLISSEFNENQALLDETQNLIGPVDLKFDLENFQNSQARKGITVKKYIWDFGGDIQESFTPTITKTFADTGDYEISVSAIGTDLQGEEIQQDISNIPAISISHVIDITENPTNNGGKKLSLDATNLENLGKVQWYFKDPEGTQNPKYPEWTYIDEGYNLIPGKIFFDEIYIGVAVVSGDEADESLDKVIVITPDDASVIQGDIDYTQSLEDELEFEFFVSNPSTDFTSGFIESYDWTIEDKTYNEPGTFEDTKTSPSIQHIFKNFGEHDIQVTMTDSKGKSSTLSKTITIQKRVELRSPLVIEDENGDEIVDMRYDKKANEYYLDDIGIPTTLKFSANNVRPINNLYALKDVMWDIENDNDIDAKGKSYTFEVPTEGNHTLIANYEFVHRKNPDDIINLAQAIYIEGVKKEAILSLDMDYDSNYVPVTVRFDASKSFIKNDDIVKFSYDYGDGVREDRDAINPGHRYTEPGDYSVQLTVTGKSGKQYSMEKKLILLPPPQGVEISTSLKSAPVGQGIDFSSAESEGQIVEYFWDFGDGNISTEANPTHSYKKPGNYSVTLKANFANNNAISDTVKVEIYKE